MRKHALVAAAFVALAVAVTAQAGLHRRPASRIPPPNWTLGGVPTWLIEVPTAAPVIVTSRPGERPGATVHNDSWLRPFNFQVAGIHHRPHHGTTGHCNH